MITLVVEFEGWFVGMLVGLVSCRLGLFWGVIMYGFVWFRFGQVSGWFGGTGEVLRFWEGRVPVVLWVRRLGCMGLW